MTLTETLIANGYQQVGRYWKKELINDRVCYASIHTTTLWSSFEFRVRLWCYDIADKEAIYDTHELDVEPKELQTLLTIFEKTL